MAASNEGGDGSDRVPRDRTRGACRFRARAWRVHINDSGTQHVAAESIHAIYQAREDAHGLRMVHEPKSLRIFQARLDPL